MKQLNIVLLFSVVVLLSTGFVSGHSHGWQLFKQRHGKNYLGQQEDSMRERIFLANKRKIAQFNAELAPKLGYSKQLNHLSDWTDDELNSLLGRQQQVRLENSIGESDDQLGSHSLPDHVDWREQANRVSEVKQQMLCGNGWAFATTGVLEGQEVNQLKNGKSLKEVISLSEQNIMDCSASTHGCHGGLITDALADLAKGRGIQDEQSYPYAYGSVNDCVFNASQAILTNSGYSVLKEGDEEELKRFVAQFGPVAVMFHVTGDIFEYRKGVFTDDKCSSDKSKLNHGFLLVGYGTDAKSGSDYWIAKNSWGPGWGDGGYILLSRNKKNMCGVATLATIPTFV